QEHAGRCRAALTGVHARRDPDQAGLLEVGVLQHDGGRLATELEEQALHRRRALFHDSLPDQRRARKGDEIDLRGERELLANQVVGGADDVDDAWWDVRALHDQATEARRVEGSVRGRLEHDRVAGGQRLGELVDRHLERVIPGNDRADDAPAFAATL